MKIILYIALPIVIILLSRYFLSYRKKNKLFKLAYAMSLNGHNINAIKIYDRLIIQSPKNFIYYNNRGHCYLVMENVEKARADFQKSIELEPDKLYNHVTYQNIKRLESFIENGYY